MQAVILAAGRGKRMGTLTENIPKPLISYNGQTLIEQKLSILPDSISEIIIVIGYLGDEIITKLGHSYKHITIRYVWQKELTGTAGALWECIPFLHDQFIVLMSDDVYHPDDIARMCQTAPNSWSVLLYKSSEKSDGGKCVINDQGHLTNIVEDFTGTIPYTYIYTGVCVLTPDIFKLEKVAIKNGEYGLPQTFVQAHSTRPITTIFSTDWKRITSPDDVR